MQQQQCTTLTTGAVVMHLGTFSRCTLSADVAGKYLLS
jgi:hypothetical protein